MVRWRQVPFQSSVLLRTEWYWKTDVTAWTSPAQERRYQVFLPLQFCQSAAKFRHSVHSHPEEKGAQVGQSLFFSVVAARNSSLLHFCVFFICLVFGGAMVPLISKLTLL